LNYTNNPNGAVANSLYGHSCFVLKDHLKQLATYCAMDSISSHVTSQTICTLKTLGALLVWMRDVTLINLDKARQSFVTQDLGDTYDFLECHLYNDVNFKNHDVQEMRLSLREVGNRADVLQNARDFAKNFNITLVEVP
jgi:hypothetical protein